MSPAAQAVGEPGWKAAGLRYHSYRWFLGRRFGKRVHRLSLDGGMTCPNVDGALAVGGCVYCDNRSFNPIRRAGARAIEDQVSRGIAALDLKFHPEAYLAYFQAGTSTYAPLDELRAMYEAALRDPRIVGLIVATRPDCAADPVLDLLESHARDRYVAVEYGLQSIHERSLRWMNRGHGAKVFFDAVARSLGRGLDVGAHVILGLPGESRADMLETIDAVAASGIDGVKIHNLHVVRNTPMELEYRQGRIPLMDRDEYVELIADVLVRLPPGMVIHRLLGDAPADWLVAPRWVLRKAEFLQAVDRELARRDAWQGKDGTGQHGTNSRILSQRLPGPR